MSEKIPSTYVKDPKKAEVMAHAEVSAREAAIKQAKAARMIVQKYLEDGVNSSTADLTPKELSDSLHEKYIGGDGTITKEGVFSVGEHGPKTLLEYIDASTAIATAANQYSDSGNLLGAAQDLEYIRGSNIEIANRNSDLAGEEFDKRTSSDTGV